MKHSSELIIKVFYKHAIFSVKFIKRFYEYFEMDILRDIIV